MKRNARILGAAALVVALGGVGAWRWHARGSSQPERRVAAVERAPMTQHALDRAHADVVAIHTTTVDDLMKPWDGASDRVARIELLHAAAHVPDPHGLAFLVKIASTSDPLAAQAAEAIGTISNHRLAGELARIARSDAPTIVRANAVRALGGSGSAQEASELAAIVADSSAPQRVRQEAALALARIADVDTADTLAATLDSLASDAGDGAAQLRISIIQALGQLHCESAHDALERHRARNLSAVELAFVERALGPQPA